MCAVVGVRSTATAKVFDEEGALKHETFWLERFPFVPAQAGTQSNEQESIFGPSIPAFAGRSGGWCLSDRFNLASSALDKLEGFASLHGALHNGLPPNVGAITLEKKPWTAPAEVLVRGGDERALIHHGGDVLEW